MPIDWFPLWLRLRVAAIATAGAAPIGIPAAYWRANRECKGKDIVDAAVTLPLVLPPTGWWAYYPPVVLGRESWFGRVYENIVGEPQVFTWQAAVWRRCCIRRRCR